MITQEINERLTSTTAGTPMGRLLRRYWWPIAGTVDLDADPVRPVRLLGEDLVLFRDAQSTLGLIGERCAHRGISMAYGIPQENGLRCAYHGWTYNSEGQVVDMPFEPACLPLKITAYPVQELGGLIWTYLGPAETRPLLPRLEMFVRDDLERVIHMQALQCNWLQCNDNSLDPVHFEHLHGRYADWWNRKHGIDRSIRSARHLKIDFDVFKYGIVKRRLEEGAPEDGDEWTIGHPFMFPHTLVQGAGALHNYQIRVPIDDTNTLHIRYDGKPALTQPVSTTVPCRHGKLVYDAGGRVESPDILSQDFAAWTGQGPISNRTREHLVTSDRGVVIYHNLLLENIEKVEHGEDPMFTIRDEAENTPFVRIPREQASWTGRRVEVPTAS
jgi:5,5'-dehydrodivanillate O-demethylase